MKLMVLKLRGLSKHKMKNLPKGNKFKTVSTPKKEMRRIVYELNNERIYMSKKKVPAHLD